MLTLSLLTTSSQITIFSPTKNIRQGQCTPPSTNIHNMHHLNAFLTSSTFHFNIILNINIISSHWRYQQQQPHSISTSSHINLKSSITTSTVSHILHVHISFMLEIHTPQVFKQHKSNKDNNFIHQLYIYIYITSHSSKTWFSRKKIQHAIGTDIYSHS